MITTFYPPFHFGGDATYVQGLSRALVREGHHVEVVHCIDAYRLKQRRTTVGDVGEDGVIVHHLKSPFGPLSPIITQQTGHPGLKSRSIRQILRDPFDVVHFHNISLIGGPSIIPWSRAAVTLYTLHEHWLLCPTHIFWKDRKKACDTRSCLSCSIKSGIPPQLWRYTGLVKRSLAAADALLAPSRYTANQHREEGFASPIHVLPLFASISAPTAAAIPPPERPRFLFVGRVTASKGIAPLLELFSTLPDYDLLVIGDGDLRPALTKTFAKYTNIRFLGHMAQLDLVNGYQSSTALIFPSLAPETFGLSVVEAFACGTPAIVRDAGGSRELVDDTGGGIVYSTTQELRHAINALAKDPTLRNNLGQRAFGGFLERFTLERHLEDYFKHIRDVQVAKHR